MGAYGLAWTLAIIFETIWTPGQNFGSKGPLVPNLKIAIFLQNPTKWVSMKLPGPPAIILGWFGPWGKLLGPRTLCQVLVFQMNSFLIWIVDQHPIYLSPGQLPRLIQLWAPDKIKHIIIFSDKRLGKSRLVVCKTRFYLLYYWQHNSTQLKKWKMWHFYLKFTDVKDR